MNRGSITIRYPETGICGLSCRLCPAYHRTSDSRCPGCKSEYRMAAGCPFITCAVKQRGIEFCWECPDSQSCDKWAGHREFGRSRDTFTSYQSLDANIAFIETDGVAEFDRQQQIREQLLGLMLAEFDAGRSRTHCCIAAALMRIGELQQALARARDGTAGMDIKEKAKLMRSILDDISDREQYLLKLRR